MMKLKKILRWTAEKGQAHRGRDQFIIIIITKSIQKPNGFRFGGILDGADLGGARAQRQVHHEGAGDFPLPLKNFKDRSAAIHYQNDINFSWTDWNNNEAK